MHRTLILISLMSCLLAAPPKLHAAAPQANRIAEAEKHWDTEDPQVFIDGNALHYYGHMNAAGEKRIAAALHNPPASLSKLRIASPGGDGLAASAIGELIHQYGLEVVVAGKGCVSACANYVFTPARKKTINPGSIILWHQSCPFRFPESPEALKKLLREQFATAKFTFSYTVNDVEITDPETLQLEYQAREDMFVEKMRAYIKALKQADKRIFSNTGIDFRINCLTDFIKLPEVPEAETSFSYTLSVEDMARFGVCNVHAPDDYAEQAATIIHSNDKLRHSAGVIQLADYPDLELLYPAHACKATLSSPEGSAETNATQQAPSSR